MTEVQVEDPTVTTPLTHAGDMLRQAREAQGLDIASLAAALRVPADKLQALEEEDWQRLPDMVFARALALSVCRQVQLEPATVMELLPQAPVQRLRSQLGINTPVRHRDVPSALPQMLGGSGKWVLIAVLLAALLGLGYWSWWQLSYADAISALHDEADNEDGMPEPLFSPVDEADTDTDTNTGTEADTNTGAGAETGAASASATTSGAVAVTAATATAAAPVPPAPTTAPAPAPVPSATPAAAAPVAAASTTGAEQQPTVAAHLSTPALRLRAQGETWIQVRGPQDQLVAEKILQAGDVFETSATRPLRVVVGKADVTQVEVHGAALDIRAKARDNVARFEVK